MCFIAIMCHFNINKNTFENYFIFQAKCFQCWNILIHLYSKNSMLIWKIYMIVILYKQYDSYQSGNFFVKFIEIKKFAMLPLTFAFQAIPRHSTLLFSLYAKPLIVINLRFPCHSKHPPGYKSMHFHSQFWWSFL